MALVEQIVRAAFPDLDLEHLRVSMGTYPEDLPRLTAPEVHVLVLEPGEEQPTVESYKAGRKPLLGSRAAFMHGRFEEIGFHGRYVNDDKGERAGRELGRRGLSLSDVSRWLETAGAMYPPNHAQDLELTIHRSPILSLLGITKLLTPEFIWTGDDGNDNPPEWLVRAEGQDVDLAFTCFAMFVEPFDGRLTAIYSTQPERMDPEALSCIPRRDPK